MDNSSESLENKDIVTNMETIECFPEIFTNTVSNDIVSDIEIADNVVKDKTKKTSKSSRIIDSDTSEEEDQESTNINEDVTERIRKSPSPVFSSKLKANKGRIIDSDSSDDETVDQSKTFNESGSNSSSNEITEKNDKVSQEPIKQNLQDIIRGIVDSESSEDEEKNHENHQNEKVSSKSNSDEDSDSNNDEPSVVKDRSNKIQRKSAQEAQKNMLLIQSESQRMYREAEISVPYHRPRQCSLKEFLGRRNIKRPGFNNGPLHQKSNIHMRGEELMKYAKHLEERAKEAEQFFRVKPITENLLNENSKSENQPDDVVSLTNAKSNEQILEKNEKSEDKNLLSEGSDKVKELSAEINLLSEETNQLSKNTNLPNTEINIIEKNLENNKDKNDSPKIITEFLVNDDDEDDEEISNLVIEICKNKTEMEPVASTSKQADELLAEYENALSKNKENENAPKILSVKAFQALDDSDDDLQIIGTESVKSDKVPKLSEGAPRLSGCPGTVIDLDEKSVMSQGIGQLMQRFVKHAKVKQPSAKGSMSIETTNQVTDGLIINLDENETNNRNPVPGLALQKLRTELQARMAQRRSEEMSKRLKQHEEEKEGYEADILDDEFEESELVLSSSESDDADDEDEEEENENEEIGLEKSSKENIIKSNSENFLDNECEVDEEIDDEEKIELSNDESEGENGENENENEDESGEESEDQENGKKKTLKRIQIMEDSDSEEELNVGTKGEKTLQRHSTDLFQSQNDDEDVIPLHQTKFKDPQTTPQFKSLISKDSELSLLSPALFSANTQGTPSDSVIMDISHSSDHGQNPNVLKRLFSESNDSSSQQNAINQLFDQTQDESSGVKYTEDELFDLCSGKFPTQKNDNPGITQKSREESKNQNDSERLYLSDDSNLEVLKLNNDDNSDKKEYKNIKKDKKKKNVVKTKKLQFSDDEGSGKENMYESEMEDENIVKVYDYDSEENEIEVAVDKAAFEKETRTFFDNEAELSESEWGSADEDERDLDKLEYEAGDADIIDNKKVRGELERIHIRQILDEDKRDVRLLQELLLEDGENHGDAVRERKFKWKNVDGGFALDQERSQEQDVQGNVSDDEDQTEWRKNRFEREKVLREKQLKLGEISSNSGLLSDSLLSETLSEKKTNLVVKKAIPEPSQIVMFDKEESFLAMSSIKKQYRGSFLKRDDATLSRLSALTRTNVDGQGGTATTSTGKGNFVFSTISPAQEKLPAEEKTRKRAPTEDISNVSKKVKKPQASKKLLLDYLE